jgi:hypothetical protein
MNQFLVCPSLLEFPENIPENSPKPIEKHRKQGSKENFAAWSRDRDPDSIAWT